MQCLTYVVSNEPCFLALHSHPKKDNIPHSQRIDCSVHSGNEIIAHMCAQLEMGSYIFGIS